MEHVEEFAPPMSKKRSSTSIKEQHSPKQKKSRLYSVKEFRKKLNTGENLSALKEFQNIIKSSEKQDYILGYLEHGGNCLELLQTLENDSSIPPAIVFDIVTLILLKINANNYGQYYNSANESCRYLINNYLPVVHKMLGLSSSKEERKVCLKLLTAMAALSSNLAKDILINVKFHTSNIELLTKHTSEKTSVRDSFIHFLIAFLVESDFHVLSILLEKSGLLTSIISGLQYDDADTVCIVIAAMKNHILENNAVMKTTKMHVFNTAVVKDIVNLYNWKGPDGLKVLDKNNKTIFEVNVVEKSKVSECVHDFLIVLCTSHKHGVIFRDPLVGLGRKNQNSLMFTVLDSLDRPWEHSYASELVINICRACPDLIKNMWNIVKPFLEPRLTEKWLKTMDFVKRLLNVLQPQCIEHSIKDLSPHQIAQIIEFLVSPAPILKMLLPENKTHIYPEVKQHISITLLDMLDKICNYLTFIKSCISDVNFKTVKQFLQNYVSKHYPVAQILLEDWREVSNEKISGKTKFEYLEILLDIFNRYKILAPQLLHNLLLSNFDLHDLLLKLPENLNETDTNHIDILQMKLVSIFLDIDRTQFLPNSEIFSYTTHLLLKLYHKTKSKDALEVLVSLLKSTNIFDKKSYEINIWVNAVLDLNSLSQDFLTNFVEIFKITEKNILEYQKELSNYTNDETSGDLNESCLEDILNSLNVKDGKLRTLGHRHFSPLLLGLLKHIQETGLPKNLKKYSEFVLFNLYHYQTLPQNYNTVLNCYTDYLTPNIVNYVQGWCEGMCESWPKSKGHLLEFKKYGDLFLSETLQEITVDESSYPDFPVDLLNMFTFYFCNLVNLDKVTENHSKNWILSIKQLKKISSLNDRFFDIILANPNLLQNFNVTHFGKSTSKGICTRAIFDLVKELKTSNQDIEAFIEVYSFNVYSSILKLLKKPKKYSIEKLSEFLQVFPLNYQNCVDIIEKISVLFCEKSILIQDNTILDILTYCLERMSFLCHQNLDLKPLENKVVLQLTSYLTDLNKENGSSKLSKAVKDYLERFPHNIGDINENLFKSLLIRNEYDKDNADLAIFLLERNSKFIKIIDQNIKNISEKKGLILPITDILLNSDAPPSTLKLIYEELESSLLKALQKPQKMGQHFLKNYNISPLIDMFMPIEKCKIFTDKVQKFEITTMFHVQLLYTCYKKVTEEENLNDKHLGNMLLTFIHLEMTLLKKFNTEDSGSNVDQVSLIFIQLLESFHTAKNAQMNLTNVTNNESFKTFCKFALKFGVSGQHVLLKALISLLKIVKDSLEKDEANLLFEMLLSHSEFLNVLLGEHGDTKSEVLLLFLTICENWTDLMEKTHVPVLLSAYRGLVTKCDRTILALLKLYESKAGQTHFYDFKPFLWGRAAATHYSVRSKIDTALTRQPKISDVLGILKEDIVNFTITNYPSKEKLRDEESSEITDCRCYDLKFLLPLFSHILAPEQQVKTYVFTRSGALSLTVVGLSSQDDEVRQAACHVLSRFYFHLEGRQSGKDNVLWLRFVEALCKGTAVQPNYKLNNFASIFFARMALILTNPKHVMYSPLSSYLSAKQDLDLSKVPELYTLLFSSEVNYKEHRIFILEILRDGLRTETDFLDFLKSMAYKLFSELFSSCLADTESRLLILEIVQSACKLPLGVKILCENYSLLSQMYNLVTTTLGEKTSGVVLPKILQIFLEIVKVRTDNYTNQMIFNVLLDTGNSKDFSSFRNSDIYTFYRTLYTIYNNLLKNSADIDIQSLLKLLLEKSNDTFCSYLYKYGCKFINEKQLGLREEDTFYFLRLLFYKSLSK